MYKEWHTFNLNFIEELHMQSSDIHRYKKSIKQGTISLKDSIWQASSSKLVISGSGLQCDGGSNKAGLQQPWSTGIAGTSFEFYFLFLRHSLQNFPVADSNSEYNFALAKSNWLDKGVGGWLWGVRWGLSLLSPNFAWLGLALTLADFSTRVPAHFNFFCWCRTFTWWHMQVLLP